MIGWLVGTLVSLIGTVMSFKFDIPTAPVIVAGLAIMFFGLLSVKFVLEWVHGQRP
jgi:ABC-type Mn2+/Zn2+ transport system permease subunit